MRNSVFNGVVAFCPSGACRSLASLVLAFSAMAFLFTGPISLAQDSKSPAVLPAPSSGKAIVCIYRTYRFTGSASHDELYRQRYSSRQTPQQRIRIHGSAAGDCRDLRSAQGCIMPEASSMSDLAARSTKPGRKENERARFEAEAGKTYYFKWTAGAMATGIKVDACGSREGSQRDTQTPSLQAR